MAVLEDIYQSIVDGDMNGATEGVNKALEDELGLLTTTMPAMRTTKDENQAMICDCRVIVTVHFDKMS